LDEPWGLATTGHEEVHHVRTIDDLRAARSRSRFVPVVHPARTVALVLGALIAAFVIMRPTLVEPRARKLRRR
jgi:hypothetical protein